MRLPSNIVRSITSYISERSIAFYDAVMAIAITLLVLELAVDDFRQFDWHAVRELFAPFTAMLISFVVLAELWIFHTRIYSLPYFHDTCSPRMTAISLFFVAVFPKATAIIGKYHDHFWSVLVYLLCLIFLLLSMVISVRISLGHASWNIFEESPIDLDDPLRVFPKDMPNAIRALSQYSQLKETFDTIRHFLLLNIWEFIIMVVTTLGSSIFIMFHAGICYFFLLLNLVSAAILRTMINRVDTATLLYEFDILLERMEELYNKCDAWRDASGHVDFDAETAQLAIEEDWEGDHAKRLATHMLELQEEHERRKDVREERHHVRKDARKKRRSKK